MRLPLVIVGVLAVLIATLLASGQQGPGAAQAAGLTISEYPVPSSNSTPFGITAGPDGALWFTDQGDQIGRITTAGTISEFPLPTAYNSPAGITAGPDGALWFTEYNGKIGRITTAGAISEYPVPTASSGPLGIAAGPYGTLWFTERNGNQIGRITTAGAISEYSVPTAGPWGIAAGPDGALWFTEFDGNQIGRITTAGAISEYPVPTASSGPLGIAAGPDGTLWFTERNGNQIGRIAPGAPLLDLVHSTISVNPASLPAECPTSSATVTVSLVDTNGLPYTQPTQVAISSSRGATDTIGGPPITTISGTATFSICSDTPGKATLSATAGGQALANTVVLTFVAPRKVIIIGGIDSSASCSSTNDGVDQIRNAIRDSVMAEQSSQLVEPEFTSADFVEFSWGSQTRCPGNPQDVEYSNTDTCIGAVKAAGKLDALLATFPADTTFDVVGHSLGGLAAAYWAASTPTTQFLRQRVHSIITLDSPLKGRRGVSGWLWTNVLFKSICNQAGVDHTSIRDIKKQTDVIRIINNPPATRRAAFVSIVCSPAGDALDGTWKAMVRNVVFDHSCAWKRSDTKSLITLSLFEGLVDDNPQPTPSLEPSPSYVSGWVTKTDAGAIEESLHMTRSLGREIELQFNGGEVVLLYRGGAVCSPFYCVGTSAPRINGSVDGIQDLTAFRTDCLKVTRCWKQISMNLAPGVHSLIVQVTTGTNSTEFKFDGFAICPRTHSGSLVVGGLPCGYSEPP